MCLFIDCGAWFVGEVIITFTLWMGETYAIKGLCPKSPF